MPKMKNDPIYNSKPYQYLIKKEKEGAFKNLNPWEGSKADKAMDKFIQPKVDWVRKKLFKKRKAQAGVE